MGGSCPLTWSWELGRSWLDLAKIMVRSFSHVILLLRVSYSLICSLVVVHDHGTHVLTE